MAWRESRLNCWRFLEAEAGGKGEGKGKGWGLRMLFGFIRVGIVFKVT